MGNDPVNHPSHYNGQFQMKPAECINLTQWLTFCLGNAVKYIWRCGNKNTEDHGYEDFKKAIWYLKRHLSLPEMAHYSGSEGDARNIFALLVKPDKSDAINFWKYFTILVLLQEGEDDYKDTLAWQLELEKMLGGLRAVMIDKGYWPDGDADVWSL